MTNLRARLVASIFATAYDNGASLPVDYSQLTEYDFGAGLNAATDIYVNPTTTIAASATTTFNFNSGLTDAFGTNVDYAMLKGILIINTGTVGITLGGTNPIVAAVTIQAGGCYFVSTPTAAGYEVSTGVSGTVTLTNVSGSVAASYRLVALGA